MNPLSNQARALIESARGADAPSATDKDRVRAALAATLGAGALASPGAASAATVKAGSASLGTTLALGTASKLALVIAAVGVLGGAGYGVSRWLGSPSTAPASSAPSSVAAVSEPPPQRLAPAVRAAAPAPLVADDHEQEPAVNTAAADGSAAEPADGAHDEPAPRPRPAKPTRSDKAPPSDKAPSTAATLAAERALVAAARDALRAGDPAAALEQLRAHEVAYPRGMLAEERAALLVLASCDAGNPDRAASLRSRFLARYPQSVHTARVTAACQ